jgi:hypothetical protein
MKLCKYMPVVTKFIARLVRVIRVFLLEIIYHTKNRHTGQGSPTSNPPSHFTWIASYVHRLVAVHVSSVTSQITEKIQNRSGNVYEYMDNECGTNTLFRKREFFKTDFLRTQWLFA